MPPAGADPLIGCFSTCLSVVAHSVVLTTARASTSPTSSSSIRPHLQSLLRAFGLGALRERQGGRERDALDDKRGGVARDEVGGAKCSVSLRLVLNTSNHSESCCLWGVGEGGEGERGRGGERERERERAGE